MHRAIARILSSVLITSALAVASPAGACGSEADMAQLRVQQFLRKLQLADGAKIQIALDDKKQRGVAQVQLKQRYGVLSLELRKLDGRWRVISR